MGDPPAKTSARQTLPRTLSKWPSSSSTTTGALSHNQRGRCWRRCWIVLSRSPATNTNVCILHALRCASHMHL
eukprot:12888414-Prorocentrum_lima.AAC.1